MRYESMLSINSLWPTDAIFRHRSMSTLAQIMVCRLTAPNHYLNQYWLIINGVLWHSPKINFQGSAHCVNFYNEFEKCICKKKTFHISQGPMSWKQQIQQNESQQKVCIFDEIYGTCTQAHTEHTLILKNYCSLILTFCIVLTLQ